MDVHIMGIFRHLAFNTPFHGDIWRIYMEVGTWARAIQVRNHQNRSTVGDRSFQANNFFFTNLKTFFFYESSCSLKAYVFALRFWHHKKGLISGYRYMHVYIFVKRGTLYVFGQIIHHPWLNAPCTWSK